MTNLRHLLVVTSATPEFGHSQAAQSVVASLVQEFAVRVPNVTVGLCCPNMVMTGETATRLNHLGVKVVDLPGVVVTAPIVRGKRDALKRAAQSILRSDSTMDYPRPSQPETLARAIDGVGADVVLMFWDTLGEFAVPMLATPAFGYIARPPQQAAIARVRTARHGLRRSVSLAMLSAQTRRHLGRLSRLRAAANICALDAQYYANHGVTCAYVSNTWADPVGDSWRQKRLEHEADRGAPAILGNIGALDATGNSFGLRYLGREVLPILDAIAGDMQWTINLCGRNQPADDVATELRHPRICIKGYVPDIDREMLSSRLMLLLNNAGPYSGGYTRVAYGFATGACLIAHRKLARSMPELIDEENCLLADTPSEIASKIERALRDDDFRWTIAAAARRTYETIYAPRHVASKLLYMIESGAVTRRDGRREVTQSGARRQECAAIEVN